MFRNKEDSKTPVNLEPELEIRESQDLQELIGKKFPFEGEKGEPCFIELQVANEHQMIWLLSIEEIRHTGGVWNKFITARDIATTIKTVAKNQKVEVTLSTGSKGGTEQALIFVDSPTPQTTPK